MNHVIRIIASTLGQSRGATGRTGADQSSQARRHAGSGRFFSTPWEGLYFEETD